MAKRRRKSVGRVKVVKGPPVGKRKAIHRRSVRKQMPKSCFLRPRDRGYPVCPASAAKTGRKVIDCKLVDAAIKRAAQHHHATVLAKARRLKARYCKK